MKEKLLTIVILLSVPVVLFATVNIGGQQLGGTGNYVQTGAGGYLSAPSVYGDSVSGTNFWVSSTLSAAHLESNYLNVGSPYTNSIGYQNGASSIGMSNTVSASNTLAVGLGLGVFDHNSNALIVGEYNEDKAGLVFSVGDGTDPVTDRSNSFEIWDDGDVVIPKPQGDVSMGIYDTP